MKHIELFAGCGGMSLGLGKAGFELLFANEISPMAGETFAFNLLSNEEHISHMKWLKSGYSQSEIELRLRENPNKAVKGEFTDVNTIEDLDKKILIGDINILLELFKNDEDFRNHYIKLGVDLVSGGPPCQSFSLAGKREKNDKKNTLPQSFADFAGLIQPKVVLLENVKGILSPFHEEGEKFYAWLEVSKAFAIQGYIPVCMLVNSKYFGVAQNRPRFILIAYREDIFTQLIKNLEDPNQILDNSWSFYLKVKDDPTLEVGLEDLNYYDIEMETNYFDGNILPEITSPRGNFMTTADAIGDLRQTFKPYCLGDSMGGYSQNLNRVFEREEINQNVEIHNHIPRSHKFAVKARFRFYQVINEFDPELKRKATLLFTGKKVENEVLEQLFTEFSKYYLYFQENGDCFYKKPKNIEEVQRLVSQIPSKKHSQRALKEFEPAPAQLTIPDDLCHYHMENLRTLTVREMARFQSFPDWFEFKSKVTTGGDNRKFEVPQYTQVGNAVPPLLAKKLGELIKNQLAEIEG